MPRPAAKHPHPPRERVGETRSDPKEFDDYSNEYEKHLDHPLRSLTSDGAYGFITAKADWMLGDLERHPVAPTGERLRLLDYGCGIGLFLRALLDARFDAELAGCDTSAGMQEEAAKLSPHGQKIPIAAVHDQRSPYPDGSFDLVVAICVFHHIDPEVRAKSLADMYRVLRPGGRFYLFEHNPLNPLTQWVVRTTPMDMNAVLLGTREARQMMTESGFVDLRTEYLMFVPPRFEALRPLENWLRWLPFGGQFVVAGSA